MTTSSMGSIMRFGGPIVYLIVYGFVLLGILVWVDSGSLLPVRVRIAKKPSTDSSRQDVVAAAAAASDSSDLLRILNVSKTFGNNKVVDEVSLGVARDTVFAMLGPNGAGKTTTFNIIREYDGSFSSTTFLTTVYRW